MPQEFTPVLIPKFLPPRHVSQLLTLCCPPIVRAVPVASSCPPVSSLYSLKPCVTSAVVSELAKAKDGLAWALPRVCGCPSVGLAHPPLLRSALCPNPHAPSVSCKF